MAAHTVTPRFLLAKYAPDLARMEPRNIGVFLWQSGTLLAKFLEEDDAAEFVSEVDVYSRWKNFWNKGISGDAIEPHRGKPVPMADPECLTALMSTQKGNYIIEDGGELVSAIRKRSLGSALDSLFRDLVAFKPENSARDRGRSFAARCLEVLTSAGIAGRDDFRPRFPVACDVYGVRQELHFSYGVGDGQPELLFQRVQLSNEESITSSATKIHCATRRMIDCRALVSTKDISSKTAEEGHKLLLQLCDVLDVDAIDSVLRLVAAAPKTRQAT